MRASGQTHQQGAGEYKRHAGKASGREYAKGEVEEAQAIDRQGADKLAGDDERHGRGAAEPRRHGER